MVAGGSVPLETDVEERLPWAAGVVLKESFGRYSAISPGMGDIREILREGTLKAVKRLEEGSLELLRIGPPAEVKIRFRNSAFAETAELLPQVGRVDGKTVVFEARNVEEAYWLVELLVFASAGVSSVVNR